MDIKSKNSHRLATIIIAAVLFICSIGMVMTYPIFEGEMESSLEHQTNEATLYSLSTSLVEGCYILYNEVYEETDRADVLQEYGGDQFDLLRKYMDYEVFDWAGKSLLGSNSDATISELEKRDDTSYAYRVAFTFQDDGEMSDIQVDSSMLNQKAQNELKQNILNCQYYNNEWSSISDPAEVQIVYGMTEENLSAYAESSGYLQVYSGSLLSENEFFVGFVVGFSILLLAVALILSLGRSFAITERKIFAAPFEAAVCVFGIACGGIYLPARVVWTTLDGGILKYITGMDGSLNRMLTFIINIIVWFVFFGMLFWSFACVCGMFTMKKQYWTERTLCGKLICYLKKDGDEYGKKVKAEAGGIWSRIKHFGRKQYDTLIHLDLKDKTNKTIFKIVGLNFLILLIVCSFWFYGIAALIIYSFVLYLFLQKYFKDTQAKYKLLLQATNQLADGDLDTQIDGDMGIFNPIQEELKKIQNGFKKAVDEEVKSERMKTELITNVSHDLKTPLTAIITYTDLVKNETDEEKRKEYISVLERKSLRLKVLIEDLFEISKAASRNVTMNFMNVDIVDLLKQVGLECDSKIKEADLDFRYKLPEHKIILSLDSQKTYRIFENLIVNITKYAMPHTRAYIEMKELESHVYISMKNVSQSELSFNTEEITDRFVRGDSSRNTEGSGLGLAIAKSFTELQHGVLEISTDADLFKVEITFPKRKDEPTKAEETGLIEGPTGNHDSEQRVGI